MKKIWAVVILLVLLLTGCVEAPEGYLYHFQVYSNGKLIYDDYVYAYSPLDDNKYEVYKTKADMDNSDGVTVIGDMVIQKVAIQEVTTGNTPVDGIGNCVNANKLSAYPLRFTDIDDPTPVPTNTLSTMSVKKDTLGVEYK